MNPLFYAVPIASVVALVFAAIFYAQMKKEDEGTPTMKKIAQFVREGAMAYLKQQYKVVIIVFAVLAGWAVLGEVMSGREIFGCGLVFVAVLLAQLPLPVLKR